MAADPFAFDLQFQDENGIQHPFGRIAIKADHAGWRSAFRYAPTYLANADLPALCPLHGAKGTADLLTYDRPLSGLPFPLEDVVPDAWGRAVLIRRYNLPREHRYPAYYLGLLEETSGALSVRQPAIGAFPYPPPPVDAVAEPVSVSRLMKVAHDFETGDPMAPELLRLLGRAGSSGGARPKATLDIDGLRRLAKFASREDRFPMTQAEAVCLDSAAALGIPVPKHELVSIHGQPVLLLDRFDVSSAGGRHHVLSMRSLLQAEDFSHGSYQDMAAILRRLSADPQADLRTLFRQMLLNVALANIDDHLKNFSMIYYQGQGWRLAPAYDITPAALANPAGGGDFHSLRFLTSDAETHSGLPPSDWRALGEAFSLSGNAVRQHIDEVCTVVDSLAQRCADHDLETAASTLFINESHRRVKAYFSRHR